MNKLRFLPQIFASKRRHAELGGFTLAEVLITIAVMAVISAVSLNSIFSFLQQQRLRQASIELIAYLHTARGRAMRESSVSGRPCEVQLTAADTELSPTNLSRNTCNDPPALEALNLRGISQSENLAITSNAGNLATYVFTFTRFGTLATENINSSSTITFPLIIYLSTNSSNVQRCVWVDTAMVRSGWRNSPNVTNCTYNEF
jgi:prepilin-type N-terminal cleavage/methylation domain-containing protein